MTGGLELIEGLTHRLGAAAEDPGANGALPQAAVAAVLRATPDDAELLLIRRAERAGDSWSGHMALPGGRAEPDDDGLRRTAVRETQEEVGIALDAVGVLLGRLPALSPRTARSPQLVVVPWVFAVPAGTTAGTSDEVALSLWVGLRELAHPDAATEHRLELAGLEPLLFPAISARGHTVWGLTHRIVTTLLQLTLPCEP